MKLQCLALFLVAACALGRTEESRDRGFSKEAAEKAFRIISEAESVNIYRVKDRVIWWLVRRWETMNTCLVPSRLQRPVLVLVGVLLIYLGAGCVLRLLHSSTLVTTPPSHPENYQTVVLWLEHGYQFLYNVIAAVLLFWLARRRHGAEDLRRTAFR